MDAGRGPTTLEAGRCHHPGCGQLETLTHIFLECEIAAAVMGWMRRLWSAVSGVPAPPCTPGVVLLGDNAAGQPGDGEGGSTAFWHALRLATLYFLWAQRCRGRERPGGSSALAVAAQVTQHLRTAIRQDAIRAYSPPTDFSILDGRWLPDRQMLTPAGFRAKWGPPGMLYSGDSLHSLRVHLTLVHPVAPP